MTRKHEAKHHDAPEPASAPVEGKPAEETLGTFPTLVVKGPLTTFVVSCEGCPTLQGEAIDEGEAIRAYRSVVGESTHSRQYKAESEKKA